MQWSARNEDVAFVRGCLVDISAGGMRLRGPVPVLRGRRLSVLLLPRGMPAALVQGRVAWVERSTAGCSFGIEAPIGPALLTLMRSSGARRADPASRHQ
jgi:hypothetical protein